MRNSAITAFPRIRLRAWFTPVAITFLAAILSMPVPASASLEDSLSSLFSARAPKGSDWSVLIENAGSRRQVFALEPERQLIPASNMKVVVCAAALLELGPGFVYETRLFRSGSARDGRLAGNLYVIGSGDPSIGGRFNGGDLTEIFRNWAHELKIGGITRIEGDIVGVAGAFDDRRHGLNWYPETFNEWYAAEVCALSFNDACVDIVVDGGAASGHAASISLNPPTRYCQIVNQFRTVSSAKQERGIYVKREIGSTLMEIAGAIRAKHRWTGYAPVHHPAKFFVTVMKETLEAEGLTVGGEARLERDNEFESNRAQCAHVASHFSRPLSELLEVCLKNSQNLYAEHFLKTLGHRKYGKGSYESGALAVKDIFYRHGCDIDNQYIADGSGLSVENRVNAKALANIHKAVSRSPHGELFQNLLPLAGVDGTLRRRMRGTAGQERVSAKTGTLNHVETHNGVLRVRSLSGFITSKSGNEYIFAMICNGPTGGSAFSQLMDEACALVAEEG